MNPQAKAQGGKVRKVMNEFGQGKLKSSSGQKVTNPKQAIAIALSEQRRVKGMNEGGDVETKGYKAHYEREKKENIADREAMDPVTWAKKAYGGIKALLNPRRDPKDAELGVPKKMAKGGALKAKINRQDTQHGKIDMPFYKLNKYAGMREGGNVMKAKMEMRHAKAMKKAGLPKSMVREEMAEAKKYARGGGIESRGKTRGTVVKMARGGGIEQRGKTKGKMV